jgi:RNA ligase
MNISLEILQRYIEEGKIISQRHPFLPLSIYNYSQKVQYDRDWDEITLMARGLVVEDSGKIIAKPFGKFFNAEELSEIPRESFEVFEKMDGSLGIAFYYAGDWHMATRGSFTSEQSKRGKKMLEKKQNCLVPALVYLFEIIYPENRIVVDYGKEEKLVLLAAFGAEMGHEIEYESLKHEHGNLPFELVKKYEGIRDFRTLRDAVKENAEGFVVKFKTGMRMKIKGEEYVKLHRILTNVSSYDIWENLRDHGELPKELFDRVPDEFFSWVRNTSSQIIENYASLEKTVKEEFQRVTDSLRNVESSEYNKEFASKVQNHEFKGLLFSMRNGRDISGHIWKLVKPAHCKPFSEKN